LAQAFAAISNGSAGSELDEFLKSLEGKSPLELIFKDVKLPGGSIVRSNQRHPDLSLLQRLAQCPARADAVPAS